MELSQQQSLESVQLPEDCVKQWELILLLLSCEEKKLDKSTDNEIDMVTYYMRNEGVRKILQQWLSQMCTKHGELNSDLHTPRKSDDVALKWRQMGNEKYRINDILESYNCYSKSVLYASRDTDVFALAVANRSASLLRLKKYKECLMDIQLALKSGYPEDLSYKLYLRQADTYFELKNFPKAQTSLNVAVEKAKRANLSASNKSDFERNFAAVEKKIQLCQTNEENDIKYNDPVCYLGENSNFIFASNGVELRKNDTYGRHVIASREIQRGNIVFVEEPYAFVALPIEEHMSIVCENCCKSNINPVPCCVCSRSIYCSEECRINAWDKFHQWECAGTQGLIWPTIGIAHLALRVLLISTTKKFSVTNVDVSQKLTATSLFKSYSEVDNMAVYKASESNDFLRVFHLVTNFDKMNNTDYIQYALTAVMLTLYLEHHTKYFEEISSKLPFKLDCDETRSFVASLILRHLGQLVCNGHAIVALNVIPDGQRTSQEREIRLATAIYPSASMMNHSCDPNIINSFQGSRLIVKASRDLECGQEVFNCYGPAYTREPAHHRRAQLKAQYLFNCTCPACEHPDKKDFILQFTAYSCHHCKGPVIVSNKKTYCKQCKSTDFDLEKTIAVMNESEDLIKQAEYCSGVEQRCEKLLLSLKLKQQVLHRHHIAVRDIMDRLACLYSEIGDWGKSIELIKQNLPSVEYQFGSFSVEVAHELRKLSDVMMERVFSQLMHPDSRQWCLETHKIIKKALQLLELNYGPWDETYLSLQHKEEVIKSVLNQNQHSGSNNSIHDLVHYNLKI